MLKYKIIKNIKPYQIIFFFISIVLIILTGCTKNNTPASSNLSELISLPYIDWTEEEIDETVFGVISYKPQKSSFGYNFFYNQKDKAYIIDMYGKIIHTWNFSAEGGWEYGTILKNGDLISTGYLVSRMNWDSNYQWMPQIRAHHDVEPALDGNFYIMSYDKKIYNGYSCLFDTILTISGSGKVLDKWSSYDSFDSLYTFYNPNFIDYHEAAPTDNKTYVYYHLNSHKLLPENSLGKKDKRFQKGNWLICLRNVNLIVILDKNTKEVVWTWGKDDLDWPHYPVMMENGEILIFDNGNHRTYSRVVQVNPLTCKITWEYKSDPPEDFHSTFEGSAQPLPNGNILVTDARKGRVFELTREKEIVWDFYNFEIKGKSRHLIYRMIRYPKDIIEKILKKHETSGAEHAKQHSKIFNSGFENKFSYATHLPDKWNYEAYKDDISVFILDSENAKSGKKSVKIVSPAMNDSRWFQIINIKPKTRYRLSGWIKTENIPTDPKISTGGACLVAHFNDAGFKKTRDVTGTTDWRYCFLDFSSKIQNKVKIELRLGFFGAVTKGIAWFDDIKLEEL